MSQPDQTHPILQVIVTVLSVIITVLCWAAALHGDPRIVSPDLIVYVIAVGATIVSILCLSEFR